MKAIIAVIGKDKPGIIAAVSAMLAKNHINIEDISQTVLQDNFTMIMLVSLDGSKLTIAELGGECDKIGADIGVEIHVQNNEIFNAIHKI